MAKPKSKNELLEQSQINYKKLINLINSYTDTEIEKEFERKSLNRNIKDILAHLHEWHLMMIQWYNIGMKGEKPDMPAKGYTWQNLDELNKKIWLKYKNSSLRTIKSLLDQSYIEIQIIINRHTNSELFEKKRYKWTGSTSLGVYIIANSSSHYNWAIKLIKKSMK